MRTYLTDACEEIDAAIFSGDVLYSAEEREELKVYFTRWNTAIASHEANEANEASGVAA